MARPWCWIGDFGFQDTSLRYAPARSVCLMLAVAAAPSPLAWRCWVTKHWASVGMSGIKVKAIARRCQEFTENFYGSAFVGTGCLLYVWKSMILVAQKSAGRLKLNSKGRNQTILHCDFARSQGSSDGQTVSSGAAATPVAETHLPCHQQRAHRARRRGTRGRGDCVTAGATGALRRASPGALGQRVFPVAFRGGRRHLHRRFR